MTLVEAKAFTKWLLLWACYFYTAVMVLSLLRSPDDSDRSRVSRSGLTVRTDALTGCQYLESQHGGLVPRVDGAGRHIGCKVIH